MPAAKSICSYCILDGTPCSFDRAAKLEHHCQQNSHKMVQQAYERGVQECHNSSLGGGVLATHLQPLLAETPPQNAVETEIVYAHGFQDGKAAEKALHDIVIKAMFDSHSREIEAAFKRGKEHSIMTAASQTLQPLQIAQFPTQTDRLQTDLQRDPYVQCTAAPQLQPAFLKNTTKDPQPLAEQSQLDTGSCSRSERLDKPEDIEGYSTEIDTQNTSKLVAAQPPPLTRQQHRKGVQIQLEQQSTPRLILPQASSQATSANLNHHGSQLMLSTKLGTTVNPTINSCIDQECINSATLTSEVESDVLVVSKVIRDIWVCSKGGDIDRICRCPSSGRLQLFNRWVEEWTPLTDSDKLVADVSKLLDVLVDKCVAESPSIWSLEQMRSLKKCSSAVNIHDVNYDLGEAKALAVQLAECLPPGQDYSSLGTQKSKLATRTSGNTSASCRARINKNATC